MRFHEIFEITLGDNGNCSSKHLLNTKMTMFNVHIVHTIRPMLSTIKSQIFWFWEILVYSFHNDTVFIFHLLVLPNFRIMRVFSGHICIQIVPLLYFYNIGKKLYATFKKTWKILTYLLGRYILRYICT